MGAYIHFALVGTNNVLGLNCLIKKKWHTATHPLLGWLQERLANNKRFLPYILIVQEFR